MQMTLPVTLEKVLCGAGNRGLQVDRLPEGRYAIQLDGAFVIARRVEDGVFFERSPGRIFDADLAISLVWKEFPYFVAVRATQRGVGSILPAIDGMEVLTDNCATYRGTPVVITRLPGSFGVFVVTDDEEVFHRIAGMVDNEASIVSGLA